MALYHRIVRDTTTVPRALWWKCKLTNSSPVAWTWNQTLNNRNLISPWPWNHIYSTTASIIFLNTVFIRITKHCETKRAHLSKRIIKPWNIVPPYRKSTHYFHIWYNHWMHVDTCLEKVSKLTCVVTVWIQKITKASPELHNKTLKCIIMIFSRISESVVFRNMIFSRHGLTGSWLYTSMWLYKF